MQVEIIHDVAVSPNYGEGRSDTTCAYPFAAVLPDGEILCVYRRGREKHSYDGVLKMQRSVDRGRTWSAPETVFNGLDRTPPWVVVDGTIACTAGGTLVGTMSLVEATRPDAYLFSAEGRTQKTMACLVRSEDRGATWSPPRELDVSMLRRGGITTKPFTLADGRLLIPLEACLADGAQGTAALFSEDEGRTVSGPVTCAADPSGELNLCDARCAVLRDGRILMLLWTFRAADEETIAVHATVSQDGGQTWSTPRATDIAGQISVPLELASGRLIALSNFRRTPEGIRLYTSTDAGGTWTAEPPVQMWDARAAQVLGTPITEIAGKAAGDGVWEALQGFTFGTPDLVALDDGTVLMAYYGTVRDICHVRACRFRLA